MPGRVLCRALAQAVARHAGHMLVVSTLAALWWAPDALRRQQDLPAACCVNWWQIHSEQSYFEMFGRPPLLQHLWSLAIENSSLAWPLLLLAAARLGGRQGDAGGGRRAGRVQRGLDNAAGHVAGRARKQADPNRLYLGTDTHAMGLLMGLCWPAILEPWAARIRPPLWLRPQPAPATVCLPGTRSPGHPAKRVAARKIPIRRTGSGQHTASGRCHTSRQTRCRCGHPSSYHRPTTPWLHECLGWAAGGGAGAVGGLSEADAGLYRWGFAGGNRWPPACSSSGHCCAHRCWAACWAAGAFHRPAFVWSVSVALAGVCCVLAYEAQTTCIGFDRTPGPDAVAD